MRTFRHGEAEAVSSQRNFQICPGGRLQAISVRWSLRRDFPESADREQRVLRHQRRAWDDCASANFSVLGTW